jgi:hypothetical protein
LIEEEESYWHKRSNSMWLLKGDSNMTFFHRIANGKKRKNTIFSLNHEDQIIEGDEALVDHATKFYKDLFGPTSPSGILMEPGCWGPSERVTEQDNEEFEKAFSEAKIKNAIFSMEKTQLLALIISQWNSTNIVGISLKMTWLSCSLTSII